MLKFVRNAPSKIHITGVKFSIKFNKPPQKKILIYSFNSETCIDKYLENLFKNNDYAVYKGLKQFNIYNFFFTLLDSGFINFKKNYFKNFIKHTNPKLAITFNDLAKQFYEIKEINNKIILITLQNGLRLKKQLLPLKGLKSDYYFTFGKYYSNLISKYIKSKFYSIGSFKNNIYKSNYLKINKKKILFISVFKENHKKIPPGEVVILNYLKKYCLKYNFKLYLFGRNVYTNNLKKQYNKIFNDFKIDFIDNKISYKSIYKIYKKFNILVLERSTFSYEALSAGKKALVLNYFIVDKKWYSKFNMVDYFPIDKNKPSEGFFWSHKPNYRLFEKKLDNLVRIKNSKLFLLSTKLINPIMTFDKGNQIFLKKLKKILKNIN